MRTILDRKAKMALSAAAVLAVSLGLTGVVAFVAPATAVGTPGRSISDFALFDETGVDTGAQCKSDKTFQFYMTVTALGGPAVVRVTFPDDVIDFFVPSGQTISLVQSAGGTPGADDELKVTVPTGTGVGWVSILTQSGARPQYDGPDPDTRPDSFCVTTP